MIVVLLLGCLAPSGSAAAQASDFFKDCPRRHRFSVHHENRLWDLHQLLQIPLATSELEIMRVADWLIDLPLPGSPLRPFRRLTETIRGSYSRLPRWHLTQRFAQFVDAFQIPELSFGDANATYSVATGGVTGPGSGMIIRVHKLVDWTQHITQDVNGLLGKPFGRKRGLISWSLPGETVDLSQWLMVKTFNSVSILVARTLEGGVTGMEMAADGMMNLGRQTPHEQQTVFLRMPMEVYRAHELWMLEHRSRIVVGPPEMFYHATHVSLAHRSKNHPAMDWLLALDRPDVTASELVVMAPSKVIARAPHALLAHVVPASWVLEASSESTIDNRTRKP